MSALLVDHDLPERITKPTWLERWHTEPIRHAPSTAILADRAVCAYSDIAHEPAGEVRDLVRTVRAAINVRHAELRDLAKGRSSALVAWVEERRAQFASHGFHVLPHHEGGYQVERDGEPLARCTSRLEAIEKRDEFAAAAGVSA